MRVAVAPATLCLAVTDLRRGRVLTTIRPAAAEGGGSALAIARGPMRRVHGLGEQFVAPGETGGDRNGRERAPGVPTGNRMVSFEGGQVGSAQFPGTYAVGDAGRATRSSSTTRMRGRAACAPTRGACARAAARRAAGS